MCVKNCFRARVFVSVLTLHIFVKGGRVSEGTGIIQRARMSENEEGKETRLQKMIGVIWVCSKKENS